MENRLVFLYQKGGGQRCKQERKSGDEAFPAGRLDCLGPPGSCPSLPPFLVGRVRDLLKETTETGYQLVLTSLLEDLVVIRSPGVVTITRPSEKLFDMQQQLLQQREQIQALKEQATGGSTTRRVESTVASCCCGLLVGALWLVSCCFGLIVCVCFWVEKLGTLDSRKQLRDFKDFSGRWWSASQSQGHPSNNLGELIWDSYLLLGFQTGLVCLGDFVQLQPLETFDFMAIWQRICGR